MITKSGLFVHFIIKLTGKIEFIMADGGAWRSNNYGGSPVTCSCKCTLAVTIKKKIKQIGQDNINNHEEI